LPLSVCHVFLVSEGPKVYGSMRGRISWMQFFNNLKIEKYLVVKFSPNSQIKVSRDQF
jgi:hypothetical protein